MSPARPGSSRTPRERPHPDWRIGGVELRNRRKRVEELHVHFLVFVWLDMRILAYAFVLAVAVMMVAIALGFPVFRSNYDESRRGEALGCYYLEGHMVMEAAADSLRLPNGVRIGYAVWTDKT